MITYEDIKKANDAIQTTAIKDKQYAEVNQRIKAFRMVYPEGFITTEMLSNEGGVCIFRAVVGCNGVALGTGTAYEKEGSTFINKTSYIENCETSAVGRALGMAGFGIDTSVASAEEVQNAIIQQTADKKIDKVKVKALKKRLENEGIPLEQIYTLYHVESLDDLDERKHAHIHAHWQNILALKDGKQG